MTGVDEIAFSSCDGFGYCLSADGSFRWCAYVGDASQWTATVFATLNGAPCVLFGGTDDYLHCVSPDGKMLWQTRGRGAGHIEGGISVGDLNG